MEQERQHPGGDNSGGTQPCPSCGHAVPASNMLMHAAFCRSIAANSSGSCPPSAASSGSLPSAPVTTVDVEAEVVDVEDDDNHEEEEDSEVMVLSPPAAAATHRRRVPPRPQQQPQPGGAAAAAVVDLTGGPVTPQQQAATAPRGQPKDDGEEDGAGATEMEEVQISCDTCTFANPPHVDVCQMCMTPLGGGGAGAQARPGGGAGGGGMAGRMQAVARAGDGDGIDDDDDDDPPPGSCWTCPMCTFSGNRRGRWVCAACEVGRPRRQDMLDAEGGDGYVMVAGGGGGGGRRPAGGRYGRAGAGVGGLDVPMRMLEDIMSGAAIGAVGGAATTALAGGGGPQTRQGMWRGAMFGALGGGLFGGLREMMTMQHQQDAFDVDNASYEDLLNLFGPGHSPAKASVETVSALPESRMTAEDVARLRREEAAGGGGGGGASKDCSICMDAFEAGDAVRSLPCLHRFHVACVDRWLTQHNASCPVCKMPIIQNNGGGR